MKMVRKISPGALAGGLLLLFISGVQAHTGHPAGGLVHGFSHPCLGWDHLLAMVAVGLLSVPQTRSRVWILPATFVSFMMVGGVLGMNQISLPGVEVGILGSVLLFGLLLSLPCRLPLPMAMALTALAALCHGHAHGSEMPAAAHAVSYAIGFVLATSLLHGLGILLALGLERVKTLPLLRLAGIAVFVGGVFLL
jgi:urease accessory protein